MTGPDGRRHFPNEDKAPHDPELRVSQGAILATTAPQFDPHGSPEAMSSAGAQRVAGPWSDARPGDKLVLKTESNSLIADTQVSARFPLAPSQRPFWFAEMAAPGTPSNNISVRWELHGPIRAADIEAGLQAIVARHEILRTRFAEIDGTPTQEVLPHAPFRLAHLDIRNIPAPDQEARIARIERELCAKGFDLSAPCQMRVTLVQTAPDRAAILIVVHHAVFDGFSIRVLGAELGGFLAARAEGRDWTPPELPLQYGDYALWRDACTDTPAHAELQAYWRDRLKDAPYLELAPDRPRTVPRELKGGRLVRPLDTAFETALEEAARRQGVSGFVLGAAAVAAALHRTTGSSDLVFGTPVAGRTETDLEPLIGAFINTLVLRLATRPGDTLDDLVRATGREVASALAHEALPFDEIRAEAGQRRDPSRMPLISTLFTLQRVFLEERAHGPYRLISMPSQSPGVLYDLNIQILGRTAGWALTIDYNAALYDAERIARLADAILEALDGVISGAAVPLAEPERGTPDAVAQDERGPGTAAPAPVASPLSAPAHLRKAIAGIWSELLALPAQQVDGDFFDLGGQSVLALRMLSAVEDRFGVRPGVADFFADPTLDGFSRRVGALLVGTEAEPEPSGLWQVLTLREGPATGPAVVSLNQPFLYRNMAQALDTDVPVFNLYIPDAEAISEHGAADVDALAAAAAEQLSALLPGRPLILAGQCADGVVALRLAEHLARSGTRVEALAMIDSWAPDAVTGRRRLRTRLRRWSHYIGRALRREAGLVQTMAKHGGLRRLLERTGHVAPPTEMERNARAANVRIARMLRDEHRWAYDGQVLLFATESQSRRAGALLFGWKGRLPADTPIYTLSGWHEDALLEHGFRRVAEVIDARLRRLN